MWYLYGYDKNNRRIVLWEGHSREEVYGEMGSSGIRRATALGCVTWELKQEWSGHVSSGR